MKRFLSNMLACVMICALLGGGAAGEADAQIARDVRIPEAAAVGKPEKADTVIRLSESGAEILGEGAVLSGSTLTIVSAGEYLLTGDWRGTIVIDVEADKKTVLNLNGVKLVGDVGAAVWVVSEPKNVTFYLCESSVNIMEDAQSYSYSDALDDIPSATLYSKEDLKFKGEGALYITSHAGKGIQSKDDIEIESGEIYVNALDDGIRGKDSVTISGGKVRIDAGADGIRSNNDEDAEKGFIEISGGEVYVKSGQDGVQAHTALTISGGALVIESGGGSANASTGSTAPEWGRWGGWGGQRSRQPSNSPADDSADSTSAKGVKAGDTLTISGGQIRIDSSDDALHSDGTMILSGGDIFISSGDDGIHADTRLDISGGQITITKSYEGIESADIRVSGGEVRVTASDDGLNAAGGADGSSVDGRAGQNWRRGMMESSTGAISITGGYVCVNASGDGIDSNGPVNMSGGTVIVYGPTSGGNGALDYSGKFMFSGGTLLAVGSAGMAQSVTGDGAGVMAFACRVSADELMAILDDGGNEVICFAAPKNYATVIYASGALTRGEYTIYAQGSHTGDILDGIYTSGEYSPGTQLGTYTVK